MRKEHMNDYDSENDSNLTEHIRGTCAIGRKVLLNLEVGQQRTSRCLDCSFTAIIKVHFCGELYVTLDRHIISFNIFDGFIFNYIMFY